MSLEDEIRVIRGMLAVQSTDGKGMLKPQRDAYEARLAELEVRRLTNR